MNKKIFIFNKIFLLLFFFVFEINSSLGKISEPENLIYGTIKINGINVKSNNSNISISIELNEIILSSYTIGNDPIAKNYYVLSIPIDSQNPQLPKTARPGDIASILINEVEAKKISIGQRGEVKNINIIIDGFLDNDDDRVPDVLEDLNADGNYNNDDTDNDGIPNYKDNDDDDDGILTVNEDSNFNGDPTDDDFDYDGIPNFLDDKVNELDSFTLIIPDSVYENVGIMANQGTIKIEKVLDNDMIITLNSYNTDRIIVPETVILLPGLQEVSFDLIIKDNNHTDCAKYVKIEASAKGWKCASKYIYIEDNEVNSKVCLSDIILILKILSDNIMNNHVLHLNHLNIDNKIGLEDVIYLLQINSHNDFN